jgi:hypothetical protein
MRPVDRFVVVAMWTIIAISFPIILTLGRYRSPELPWPYLMALCLMWLAPALSLGQLNGTEPPSPWFYRFAALAAIWIVGIAACYAIKVLAA